MQIEYNGVSMGFMICLASQRVEDKKRSHSQSGASKRRMNDNNLKVPMVPIDVNWEKQHINRAWIFNSCMPFLDSVQSVPSSDTTLVRGSTAHNCILLGSHFLQEIRTKCRNVMWNGIFVLYHTSSV